MSDETLAKNKKAYDPWFGMCQTHTPSRLGYLDAAYDADERLAKGEHQAQCTTCFRWLWPHEQGAGFAATDAKDTD